MQSGSDLSDLDGGVTQDIYTRAGVTADGQAELEREMVQQSKNEQKFFAQEFSPYLTQNAIVTWKR